MKSLSQWLSGLKPASLTTWMIAPFFLFSPQVAAIGNTIVRQDPNQIQQLVQQFAKEQSDGLPGQVTLQIAALDPRINLAQCEKAQAFLPKGGRLWGKSTVGVRCTNPVNWTIFIQVQVQVLGEYIIANNAITQGQLIKKEHLGTKTGDLCTLQPGIITDMTQIINKTATSALLAGMPIRLDNLRRPQIIQAGQLVRLNSVGTGFSISTDARAIGSASEGQVIQVKTANGQQISAIAKGVGLVEVVN